MFGEIHIINGKPRKVIKRKGKYYVRIAVEFEETEYSRGEMKIQEFAKNFTDLMRELLTGFNKSLGWVKQDEGLRNAGSLYDNRLSRHIESAVYKAIQEVAQCPMDIHSN